MYFFRHRTVRYVGVCAFPGRAGVRRPTDGSRCPDLNNSRWRAVRNKVPSSSPLSFPLIQELASELSCMGYSSKPLSPIFRDLAQFFFVRDDDEWI